MIGKLIGWIGVLITVYGMFFFFIKARDWYGRRG